MYNVGYSKEGDKVSVRIERRPWWAEAAALIADKVCVLTGHRWCNSVVGNVDQWIVDRWTESYHIPSTKADIEVFNVWLHDELPFWVEDEDEDNDEAHGDKWDTR